MVGDIYQHVQPNGRPVYSWATQRETDPNFSQALLRPPGTAPPARRSDTQRATTRRPYRQPGANTERLLLSGYTLYRAVEDVFLLKTQQRQDDTPSGRELTSLSQTFNGQRVATDADIAQFVDRLNGQVVPDLADLAERNPRVVVQRNAPRHILNTRLLQMAAQRAHKRLVVWNAVHLPVRNKDQAEATPLTPLDQMQALLQADQLAEGLTPDTWYFEGAIYLLADTTKDKGAAAGACRNNLVRAVGLVTDPREPSDNGAGPFWRLRYLPQAVLNRPRPLHRRPACVPRRPRLRRSRRRLPRGSPLHEKHHACA